MISKKKISKKRQTILLIAFIGFIVGSYIVARSTFLKKPKIDDDFLMDPAAIDEDYYDDDYIGPKDDQGELTIPLLEGTPSQIESPELELFGSSSFSYFDAPKIFFISPIRSHTNGGAPVVISGSNFGDKRGNGQVSFGSTQAVSYTNWSNEKIEVTSPPHSLSSVKISIITNSGATTTTDEPLFQYTDALPPKISSISPTFGPKGGATEVTIIGTNFGDKQLSGFVSLDGTQVSSYVSWSDKKIIVETLPHDAGFVDVSIRVSNELTDIHRSSFEYIDYDTPVITSISPKEGLVTGDFTVTITGLNYGPKQSDGVVIFNGVEAESYISWSDNEIVVVGPPNLKEIVEVKVKNDIGLISKENYVAETFRNLKAYIQLPIKIDYAKFGNPGIFELPEEDEEESEQPSN